MLTGTVFFNTSFSYQMVNPLCSSREENNADHLMDAVLKEMNNLGQNGPTQVDLDKFRAEYRRVQEQQLTQNQWWLGYLTKQYQNQEIPVSLSGDNQLLDKLTTASLKKAANVYFDGKNEIRFELLPQNN